MSQISSVSSATIGAGSVSAQAVVGESGGAAATPTGLNAAAGSTGGTVALSSASRAVSQTSSQSLSLTSSASADDKMAALIIALIEIVLGLKKKDDDQGDKLLAGLAGLLALSAGRQSGGQYQSLEFSQSSQVTQISTTTNVAAVQAGAYSRGASGTDNGASTGGNFSTVA